MAIQEITETEIVQRCAVCDGENRVSVGDLAVGIERDDQAEDGVIQMPECPRCHAREFLLRSPGEEQEHPSPGSAGALHRLLVDELHSELVKKGRVIGRLKERVSKVPTRPLPSATRAALFKDGLKLPSRAVEELQRKEPSK